MDYYIVDTHDEQHEIAGDGFSIDNSILKIHRNQRVIGAFCKWNWFQIRGEGSACEEGDQPTVPPLQDIIDILKKLGEK